MTSDPNTPVDRYSLDGCPIGDGGVLSRLVIEAMPYGDEIVITVEQAPLRPAVATHWKPNQISIQGIETLRGLRDVLTVVLDRIVDRRMNDE